MEFELNAAPLFCRMAKLTNIAQLPPFSIQSLICFTHLFRRGLCVRRDIATQVQAAIADYLRDGLY